MVELTLQVPNSLAQQIRPISNWLPTIIELSVANFTASQIKKESDELIAFLSGNPKPETILQYKISDNSQNRVSQLLEKNGTGRINSTESKELDEWQKFNNICFRLSAQTLKLTK
jgi:hypothetical protein